MTGPSPYETLAERLSRYLGPNTARVALKTFFTRQSSREPETLRWEEVPGLLEALRPMLRTLLGRTRAEDLVAEISRDIT